MSVDTLTLAQRLRAAELPASQAEAIAAAIGSAVLEAAATKEDVAALKAELKADIVAVRTELKADIAAVRSEVAALDAKFDTKFEQFRTEMVRANNQLFVRTVSTQTALLGLIVAAVKLL